MAELGQRPHGSDCVHHLKAGLARREDALLPRDHDHGHGPKQSVSRAGGQIERTRSQSGDAHPSAAGEPAVGRRHKSSGLFVAGEHQFDGRHAQRLDNVEVFLARNAKDVFNALIFEGGHQQVRAFCHGSGR